MNDVAAYFDAKSVSWGEMEKRTKSPVQAAVALMAGVRAGASVLDLGCGLGVMVPALEEMGARRILGVDLSSGMIERARELRGDNPIVEFLTADAATLDLEERFDSVIIYNAYPHFMDRSALVSTCHRLLKEGGRFCVAHGTGRDGINSHHEAVAAGVSVGLEPAQVECAAWEPFFTIDAVVDTPAFYAFAGVRKDV